MITIARSQGQSGLSAQNEEPTPQDSIHTHTIHTTQPSITEAKPASGNTSTKRVDLMTHTTHTRNRDRANSLTLPKALVSTKKTSTQRRFAMSSTESINNPGKEMA